ncbi:DUF4250 family protein [Paraclostridium sordellii]|uniref:DUF4250 family protein n=1 Tax=Paraclostridium sordellii TaxID=1505 RepID=UPI001897D76A|nr:DUF4250 family protein [Paeniclostridium sordellii]
MNRVEFDDLKIVDQVEYINKKLDEGDTLTNICKGIGIGRTTIRDRFKSISYEYNKNTKQYESFIEIIEEARVMNNKQSKLESSNKVVGATIDRNKVLEDMVLKYSDMNNKLNEMYEWYKLKSSNNVVEHKKLVIEDFEGDVVVRSYKLYEPVQKEFAEFCKGNKYKVQDLLSQAIKNFLEEYK